MSWKTLDLDGDGGQDYEQDNFEEDTESAEQDGTFEDETEEDQEGSVEIEYSQEEDDDFEDEDSDGEESSESSGSDRQNNSRKSKGRSRKSRAQERIRQLVAEKKKAEEEMMKLKSEMESFKKSSLQSQKESVSAQKNAITNQITDLEQRLVRAIEDDDAATQAKLYREMNQLEVDRRVLEAQENKYSSQVTQDEDPTQQQQQQQLDLPEEMVYWLEENPWVTNPVSRDDRKRIMAAREIGRELLQDGYLESEPEYYEELDARLEKRFGSLDEDDVEYEMKDKKQSSSQDVNRRSNNRRKTSSKKQAVSGRASSAPASRKGKITLTPQDREMARSLNISEERYALRKKQYESKDSGWINILEN